MASRGSRLPFFVHLGRVVRAVAVVTVGGVVLSGVEAVLPVSPAGAAAAPVVVASVGERPDVGSAAAAARVQGSRVKVEGASLGAFLPTSAAREMV